MASPRTPTERSAARQSARSTCSLKHGLIIFAVVVTLYLLAKCVSRVRYGVSGQCTVKPYRESTLDRVPRVQAHMLHNNDLRDSEREGEALEAHGDRSCELWLCGSNKGARKHDGLACLLQRPAGWVLYTASVRKNSTARHEIEAF